MSMGIREAVPQIIRNSDIVEVAKHLGMAVTERGAEKKAICPFHKDSEPSLVLYNKPGTRQHFHCYACGAHGDVFGLVQEKLQCDFKESVKWLAQFYRLNLRESAKSKKIAAIKAIPESETPSGANELALKIYKRRNGVARVKEWLNERSIPDTAIQSAELALATPGTLVGEVVSQMEKGEDGRFTQGVLQDQKLIVPVRRIEPSRSLLSETEEHFRDFYFEPRLIFPIRDKSGILAGFAGRIIGTSPHAKSPKYLFSPGLPRAHILYREAAARASLVRQLSQSTTSEKAELYICEGLVDALRLESLGLAAVALLGANASKEQVSLLTDIATETRGKGDLICHIFLDRDAAGIRGAAKLVAALAEANVESTYIWPTTDQLERLGVSGEDRKDPDSILKGIDSAELPPILKSWMRPPGLAVIAVAMGNDSTPDDILDEDRWKTQSLSRRYRAAVNLSPSSLAAAFLLDAAVCDPATVGAVWYQDVIGFRQPRAHQSLLARDARQSLFIEDINARLTNARELAKSGSRRGELPSDDAAWRRIESGATAFNVGLRERLGLQTYKPLEVFDAVLVARSFGEDEGRLKTMPCPEDLILQQYMLSELLTERLDDPANGLPFSAYIPAVRYYRESSTTETTAEDNSFERHKDVLSFAYQIDMDVLEGRKNPTNQGMFRPYIECWRDFNRTLRKHSEAFGEVYVLRLDVKRYYDRLTRSAIRDRLLAPMESAIHVLETSKQKPAFSPDFLSGKQNPAESIVDWLCDQSFDFDYYHPNTGRIETSKPNLGIPQGPPLSAWLATVALFPLDSAIRKELRLINGEPNDPPQAAYARYVDDIFLIARTPVALQRLRAVAEDIAKFLRIELLPKGKLFPRMTSAEFSELLAQGKAFTASGPAQEIGVLHIGDGAAINDTWLEEDVQRASALQLLSDRRLYMVEPGLVQDQLYTALRAVDLRPGELSKVARWIWYQVAGNEAFRPQDAWDEYWHLWGILTKGVMWTLAPSVRPWDDPAMYALDGLELMLSNANAYESALPPEVDRVRRKRIERLSKTVLDSQFISGFLVPGPGAPQRAGDGALKLLRTFTQRCIYIRWVACQLLACPVNQSFLQVLGQAEVVLTEEQIASLTRALITDSEVQSQGTVARADRGAPPSAKHEHRRLFVWLHQAIVLLGRSRTPLTAQVDEIEDPISEIAGDLITLYDRALHRDTQSLSSGLNISSDSEFLNVLRLWTPQLQNETPRFPALAGSALSTLLAVCDAANLSACLQNRSALLSSVLKARPLPIPPGISTPYMLLAVDSPPNESSSLTSIQEILDLRFDLAVGVDEQPVVPILGTAEISKVIDLDWNPIDQSGLTEKVRVARATWSEDVRLAFNAPPPAQAAFGPQHLRWAAEAFMCLARLSWEYSEKQSGPKDDKLEHVLAWPYIVLSDFPELARDQKFSNLNVASIGFVSPKGRLAKAAFARDGSGRLKTYQVPLADAWLWRIGFAITDMLGLARELDRYHKLEQLPATYAFDAADYILHALLRRLRGDFAPAFELPRHHAHSHLPGTVARALELLGSFPDETSDAAGLVYALSIEAESRAMEARKSGVWTFDQAGECVAFAEKIAVSVMTRLPSQWAIALPNIEKQETSSRRSVHAWEELDRRLSALAESNTFAQGVESIKLGWQVLTNGLRLACITAWLRALVFELETAGGFVPGAPEDLPSEWGLEHATLYANSTYESLKEIYETALSKDGHVGLLTDVTPLGWLAIVTYKLNLYSGGDSRINLPPSAFVDAVKSTSLLADILGRTLETKDGTKWPFEGFDATNIDLCDRKSYLESLEALKELDAALGFRTKSVVSDLWGIKPYSDKFIDSQGKAWLRTKVLVDQLTNDRHIESVQIGRKLVYQWSETRNSGGDLIGVSALGAKFALLALGSTGFGAEASTHVFDDMLSTNQSVAAAGGEEPADLREEASVGEISTTQELTESAPAPAPAPAPAAAAEAAAENAPVVDPATEEEKTPLPPPIADISLEKWRGLQQSAWARRSERAPAHNRIAFLQFRVDETYTHPLLDTGFPTEIEMLLETDHAALRAFRSALLSPAASDVLPVKAEQTEKTKSLDVARNESLRLARAAASTSTTEHFWARSELLPSWVEHRRRCIIEQTVRACDKFKVEILVLPEYSIRPDTVRWLKNLLKATGSELSVVAGTYRLHGNHNDWHFSDLHAEIFGLEDRDEILSPPVEGLTGEKSSMLTLLQPVSLSDGYKDVAVFTRRKKYPSLAMGEIFNPPSKEWAPLLELAPLVEELNYLRANNKLPLLSTAEVVKIARGCFAAERIAELVCSELFIATSPANVNMIQGEYLSLRKRFGWPSTDANALTEDIRKIVDKISHMSAKFDRRTLIVVPAYTTRSADYWIFGQSALLAAGLTTIFCAAVSKDSKGGSCFIGKSSWEDARHKPGLVPNTPYAGWSRGIYYNKATDALAQDEQALVIADIDPIYMSEGKPRPQALPVPIQLVAHLPLIECANRENLIKCYPIWSDPSLSSKPSDEKLKVGLKEYGIRDKSELLERTRVIGSLLARSGTPNKLLDPSVKIPGTTKTALLVAQDMQEFFKDKSSWNSRVEHWNRNWREMPAYGEPPTLVDWLAVDLDIDFDVGLPLIFVPPWGSDDN